MTHRIARWSRTLFDLNIAWFGWKMHGEAIRGGRGGSSSYRVVSEPHAFASVIAFCSTCFGRSLNPVREGFMFGEVVIVVHLVKVFRSDPVGASVVQCVSAYCWSRSSGGSRGSTRATLLRLVAVADDACVSTHRSRNGSRRSAHRREASLRAIGGLLIVPQGGSSGNACVALQGVRYDTRKYIVGVVPSAVVATVIQLVVGGCTSRTVDRSAARLRYQWDVCDVVFSVSLRSTY